MKNVIPFLLLLALAACHSGSDQKTGVASDSTQAAQAVSPSDPLPSWNAGALKTAIIAFVKEVTDSNSKNYIPVADRIATFDNDGTLWAERPYVQQLFAFAMVKKMVEQKPVLAKQQPFKAVVEKDKTYFEKNGDKAFIQLILATHTGMSETAFDASVTDFFATARFPGRDVPVSQVRYQPQLELLDYLRANGFKTYICSGGTQEFMRSISSAYYGIPKEQVIGTTFKYRFVDSNRSIMRLPALDHFNDKEGKPVGIQYAIGKKPVFACGNEGGAGDIAMLKFSQSNKYPSFQMIVNHNDSTREFYYQEKDSASLKAAAKNNWHVVSMKDDWGKVYADK